MPRGAFLILLFGTACLGPVRAQSPSSATPPGPAPANPRGPQFSDPRLSEINTLLDPVRTRPLSDLDFYTRGATPDYARVKRLLIDWIEARMETSGADLSALQASLNQDIERAGLRCPASQLDTPVVTLPDREGCADSDGHGYLEPVHFSMISGHLAVTTSIGLLCGSDQSLYLYRRRGKAWERVLADERIDYSAKDYRPQVIHQVLLSERAPDGSRLLLKVAGEPWCFDSWRNLYYSVWQVAPTGAKRMVNETVGFVYNPEESVGRVTPREVLVAYNGTALDARNYLAIQHLEISKGKVKDLDPVALHPLGFVNEWIKQPWKASAARSVSDAKAPSSANLREWHERLQSSDQFWAHFRYPAMQRCANGDWEIGLKEIDGEVHGNLRGPLFFYVRAEAALAFRMVRIAEKADASCDVPVHVDELPVASIPMR